MKGTFGAAALPKSQVGSTPAALVRLGHLRIVPNLDRTISIHERSAHQRGATATAEAWISSDCRSAASE